MSPDADHEIDWKDAARYTPLRDADRSIFAWEWLRRDPCYRAAAMAALEGRIQDEGAVPASRWGLHAFEMPDRTAPSARPMWRSDICANVLPVSTMKPGAAADAFMLADFRPLATIVRDAGGERLLLSDGLRVVRIDVLTGSVARGPVQLCHLLTGFASVDGPLLALRRLIALQRTGRFSRSLHAREARAGRWILMLRAHDALAAGADQRAIAGHLLGRDAHGPLWRSRASSLRSRAQRLVRAARLMAQGGYRDLLR